MKIVNELDFMLKIIDWLEKNQELTYQVINGPYYDQDQGCWKITLCDIFDTFTLYDDVDRKIQVEMR